MLNPISPRRSTRLSFRFAAVVALLATLIPVRTFADAYDAPAGYYSAATGTGATLKQQLYTITSSNFTYRSYGDSRYTLNLLWQDPANAANTLLVYTNTSVSGTWDNGITWNREHIVPENALGISVTNAYKGYGSDLFELAPSDPNVNSSRSNNGYGYTGSTSTPSGIYYGNVTGTDGATYWNAGPAFQGDVARTAFYMATRYGQNQGTTGIDANNDYNITLANGVPNTTGRFGDLNTMLHWAYTDPVDTFERRKNQLVYTGLVANINGTNTNESQGNRNPYIDHPEYIWSVFGTKANTSQLSVATPAADGASSKTLNLGKAIVGNAFATQSVTLSKTGDTPTTFNVTSGGTATSSLTGTGQTFDYGNASKSMSVGLATSATAGAVSGTVTVDNTDLTSSATGTGLADSNDVVTLTGTAVDHSTASFSTTGTVTHLTIPFGQYAQGSGSQTRSFSIADLLSASGYTAALNLNTITGSGNTGKFTTTLAAFTNLAAGSSNAFNALFDTTTIGSFSASYLLGVSDEVIPGATAGPSLTLDLTGSVVAVPEPGVGLFVLVIAAGALRRRRGFSA